MNRPSPCIALAALSVAVLMSACTSPVSQSSAPRTAVDKDGAISVEERPGGFLIAMSYSRYQLVPETSSVQDACIRALTAGAYDEADRRGRKIDPINEQRIRVSMGRNGLSGITSCEASVPVFWAR